MTRRPIKGWLFCVLVFGIALYGGIYLWGAHSEAFRFAEQAIESSRAMESRVGHVEHVSLSPIGGYREKFVNANKSVHMVLDVVGATSKATVNVFAQKTDGVWEIKEASIDGQKVALNN